MDWNPKEVVVLVHIIHNGSLRRREQDYLSPQPIYVSSSRVMHHEGLPRYWYSRTCCILLSP